MNSKHIFTLFSLVIASLAVSCQAPSLDLEPAGEDGWVTVPYSLKVGKPADTKVDYSATAGYSFNAGDKISISGVGRDDISGTLTLSSGNSYAGSLTYNTNEGDIEGASLRATLVHAANNVKAQYANAIVPIEVSGTPTDEAIAAALASALDEAAEKYTLFSKDYTYGAEAVSLVQNAAFLNIEVDFTGYILGSLPTGETPVEVSFSHGGVNQTVTGNAILVKEGNDYKARFLAVIPGDGTTLVKEESKVTICDRDIIFLGSTKDNKVLENNKLYTVTPRTVDMSPQLGDPFWSDGTYGRIAHDNGATVTGIIVFVNNYADSNDSDLAKEARALTEKAGGFGHALVMSIKNAGEGVKWATSNTSNGISCITSPSQILSTTNVSGYSNTNTLIGNNANTAAITAHNYRSGDTTTGTSGWFLPSIGQWVYSISERGFGGAAPAEQWLRNNPYTNWLGTGSMNDLVLVKNNGSATENLLVKSLNDRLQVLQDDFGCNYDTFGMYYLDPIDGDCYSDNYWSSSEYSSSNAIRMNFGSVETRADTGDKYSSIKVKGESKQSTSSWKLHFVMKVRPFLAF